MGSCVDAVVVALFVLLLTLLVLVWSIWKSPEAFWSGALGGPAVSSAWAAHLRSARIHFMDSIWLREEAYVNLDGEGLDLADEFLRDALHRLGGLAGAW
ncbi:hypothetical protein ACQCP0_19605 [Ralstonia pseudosolanacearum]|uniref:Uncharacterized protein n=3 Tax=root TaxID=1 RepID=A0JC08_9VIRU|nr:hypothetical protein [Ralstonia pseudosolanacearum]YP_863908.1 hypothetical protein RPRV1_gp04 [Ralstonia phage RSM1]AXW37810.1 hypothetical protein CJO89_05545 [Ralstonia solanacearum]KAF3462072.1 hypothetical protein GO278_001370 [Ralstonia solanacearum]NKA77099.1 hypothetical protein [Ralstonia solanacearum]NKF54710.1 hypothetical protein [Ralstonia solanacearum]NKF64192.1 hypothetical protein [Ralstonia solanacearum]